MPQDQLNFDAFRDAVLRGAMNGLDVGAQALQVTAEAGGNFRTRPKPRARRYGSVCARPGDDLFHQAVAIVAARNPTGLEVNGESADADAVLVLTSPTSYAAKLEIEHGGALLMP